MDALRAPQRPGIDPTLTWVIADLDAVRHSAAALHREVVHGVRTPPVKLLWLHGQEPPGAALMAQAHALPREAADTALHALLRPQAASARPAPLLADAAPAPATPSESPLGLRVLLVEDNTVNLLVAQRLLQVLGCEVSTAQDGEQALRHLHAHAVDIVLMDCQMPVLDGYTATRRWREHEAGSHAARLPIVAMTANAMAGDRERCLQAGMDDYLSKPIQRESLQACLLRWHAPRASLGDAVVAIAPPADVPQAWEDDAALLSAIAADPAEESAALPVLDAQVLDELLEVIGAGTAQIIGVFLDDTPPLIRQLQEASVAADLPELRALAHSLKSASANVGALALSAAARRIEHDARAGTLERPAVAVALLIAEFARARIALGGYLARLHAPQGH